MVTDRSNHLLNLSVRPTSNAVGAFATGITVVVVLTAKFTDGARITVLLIPALILLMYSIHRHYRRVEQATALDTAVNTQNLCEPIILLQLKYGVRRRRKPCDSHGRFRNKSALFMLNAARMTRRSDGGDLALGSLDLGHQLRAVEVFHARERALGVTKLTEALIKSDRAHSDGTHNPTS